MQNARSHEPQGGNARQQVVVNHKKFTGQKSKRTKPELPHLGGCLNMRMEQSLLGLLQGCCLSILLVKQPLL